MNIKEKLALKISGRLRTCLKCKKHFEKTKDLNYFCKKCDGELQKYVDETFEKEYPDAARFPDELFKDMFQNENKKNSSK